MKKFLISFLVLSFAFLVSASPVSAKVISSQSGAVSVGENEIINDDLFVGAETLNIEGTVNGDVFAGAETVNISGVVNGNLHVGASTVNLSGDVGGNVYVGAGTLNVSGARVAGSVIVGAGNVNLDKETLVSGSVIAGTGNISLDSTVRRNVMLGAGSAVIGPNARISKDLYYAIGDQEQDLVIPDTAVVSGNIYKSDTGYRASDVEVKQEQFLSALRAARVSAIIGGFLSALLIGYLYLQFFKNHFLKTSALVSENFWKTLGIGLMVSVLALPAFVLLLITIVGIPLAGLLFLIFLIFTYLAKIVVALSLGKWIVAQFKWSKATTFGAFAVGLLTIYVLKFIPMVGGLTGMAVFLSGMGALALTFTSKSE